MNLGCDYKPSTAYFEALFKREGFNADIAKDLGPVLRASPAQKPREIVRKRYITLKFR